MYRVLLLIGLLLPINVYADTTVVGNGSADGVAITPTDVTASGTVTFSNLSGLTDTDYLTISGGGLVSASAPIGNGKLVQQVNVQDGAVATGSTVVPIDDSIPQNDEGDEYMTLAITPTDAGNKLKIDVVVILSSSAVGFLQAALFQDSTANALASAVMYQTTATGITILSFTHYMAAGTTSETTFKVRAGSNAVGTTTTNGNTGARNHGGVLSSSMTIAEVIP